MKRNATAHVIWTVTILLIIDNLLDIKACGETGKKCLTDRRRQSYGHKIRHHGAKLNDYRKKGGEQGIYTYPPLSPCAQKLPLYFQQSYQTNANSMLLLVRFAPTSLP